VHLLSGSIDGKPPWLKQVAEGDEAGLYLPNQAPWIVHADFATLVGGIRALGSAIEAVSALAAPTERASR
jgi:hypothetical protein